MNKRSAMLIAAGLVAALFAGGTALSFSLAGGTAAAQDTPRVDPIIRTKHRTITVHEKAKADPGRVVRVSLPPSAPTGSQVSGASGPSGGDDAYEHETEDQEHEYQGPDDGGSEDHSGDDSDGSHGDD